MSDTLDSKVWLITGASRGLGRALAEAALAAGHRVVATARNIEHLEELNWRYSDRVRTDALNVTDERAAESAVGSAVSAFGRLDVLVNTAGYGDVGSIEDTPLADFRAQIETNLFGVIIVTKAAIPVMRAQGTGRIFQFSSIGGRVGPAGRAAYSAAKWGVEGFSEVLANEVGPLGIKVTIVEPGAFRTDFAGASTTLRDGRPEYDATVGQMARRQRELNGKQLGDPARAAAVLLRVAALDEPPLRLLLGSDAVDAATRSALSRKSADAKWRDLSRSTDFDQSVDSNPQSRGGAAFRGPSQRPTLAIAQRRLMQRRILRHEPFDALEIVAVNGFLELTAFFKGLDVGLQLRPARKTVASRNVKLRIG